MSRRLLTALCLATLAVTAAAGCSAPAPAPEPEPEAAIDEAPRPAFTIYRDELVVVLDRGLQPLIADVNLRPAVEDDRFVGWRIQFLKPTESPYRASAVRPGDVLTKVNGQALERPDQMMAVWKTLRDSDAITFSVIRAGKPLDITYSIRDRGRP